MMALCVSGTLTPWPSALPIFLAPHAVALHSPHERIMEQICWVPVKLQARVFVLRGGWGPGGSVRLPARARARASALVAPFLCCRVGT